MNVYICMDVTVGLKSNNYLNINQCTCFNIAKPCHKRNPTFNISYTFIRKDCRMFVNVYTYTYFKQGYALYIYIYIQIHHCSL